MVVVSFFLLYSYLTFAFFYLFVHLGVFSIRQFFIVYFLSVLLTLLYIKKSSIKIKSVLSDKSTIFTFLFIIFIISKTFLGFANGLRFPIVSGWDSAGHFFMMKDSIENNPILVQGTKITAYNFDYPEKLNEYKFGYPSGFYLVAASIARDLLGFVEKSNYNVFLINFFFLYQYFLIALSALVFIFLLKEFSPEKKWNKTYLIAFLFSVFFYIGVVGISSLLIGFSSFISFSFYFLAFIYFLIRFWKNEKLLDFILLLISNFLAISSWFFVFLPLFIIVFIILIYKRKIFKFDYFISLNIYIASVLYYLYWHIYLSDYSLSFAKEVVSVLDLGGVQRLNFVYWILLLVINFIFYKDQNRRKKFFSILLFNIIYGIFLFILAIFQFITAGNVSYFFYKSAFVIYPVFLLPVYYFLTKSISSKKILYKSYNKFFNFQFKLESKNTIIFYLLSLFFFFLLFKITADTVLYRYKMRFILPPKIDQFSYNTLLLIGEKYNLDDYMLAVFPIDETLTLWSGALYGRNLYFFNPYQNFKNWALDKESMKQAFFSYLKEERSKYKILIVDLRCWFDVEYRNKLISVNKRIEFLRPGCTN